MNREVHDFLKGIGIHAVLEHKVGGLRYDLFVPASKLLIEMNGVRWHSGPESKKRDLKKWTTAVEAGYRMMSIFEDEWTTRKDIMGSMIASASGHHRFVRVRAGKCSITQVGHVDVKRLYDSFHYIGSCAASNHYGVIFNGELIGAASFRKPSRANTRGDVELCRMVMDPSFRSPGIWTRVLNRFMFDHSVDSVVTFSDNRVFTGHTYHAMGFVFDGDVKPDYYWVKGPKRFHKSRLRKPAGSSVTENELREAQGYRKIWDLGKKRWIYARR